MNPIIYLPIELQAREFESKALLTAILTQRGYPVVFGQQWMMYANLDRLPAGVFLSKSFNRFHQPAMLSAKRAGHRVFAMEEEMLAVIEEKAVAYLCNSGIFDVVDVILSHGRFEHDMLQRLGGGKARIEIAGNGRLDLLKPGFRTYYRKQIDEIMRRYGDFVLVNTNFATINSIWKSVEKVTELMIQGGFHDRNDPQSMKLWHDIVESERANQAAMLAAIRELARRRPMHAIVVRPHPGEDLRRWDGEFAGLPNVAVVREGAHVPWTLASRVLLHSSCTTGFEAAVSGTPSLGLVPRPGWLSESLLSNKINPVFSDPLALVDATEAILDGRSSVSTSPGIAAAEHYAWNCGPNDGSCRIAELLTEGLPEPRGLAIPSLGSVARDEVSKGKILVSLEQCQEMVQRIATAAGIRAGPRIEALGESLFVAVPAHTGKQISVSPPQPGYAELRAAIETARQTGNYQKAYDTFKQNQAEAHRHPDLCFFTGVALFETGRFALALQYFQHAALMGGSAVDPKVSYWTARTHQRLGELGVARRYAEQAYRLVPMANDFFDLFKELALRTGIDVPEHWIVIGCSHVRYFRFMQLNQLKFFAGRVHLECHEFGGATAYGLGNANSESGALNATRQLRTRIAQADRVLVMFGEIDCRRAAWKAAVVSGRTIEETIGESVAQLENYVRREVLPHNSTVLILGAKPQIIADEDFYRNSLIDERIVFKPLGERERITAIFNAQARESATRLQVDYADFQHVVADENSRHQFFEKVFWDTYTTDTHGNVDYLARLYFERLQEFL